uniref:C-type lectin domain-containing protein n=1 Tax=Acrobeloides nanus TaxID=290746 RepID=A0A914E0X3_9BILA
MAKSIFINVENVWVGGNRVTVPGNWTWTDGKPFVYTNWAKGEPSATQGNDYLAVGASTGTWSAQPNSLNLPYICEVLPSPESTSTCPTISSPSCTSQPCVCSTPSVTDYCPSGWKYFNYTRECYYLGTAEDWGTARLYCVQIGGQLASIHNHEENTFIADLTNGNTNPIWTGLNKYSGDWSWIDGTPYDYQNWDCHSCPDGCEPHSTWQCGCMIGICGNPDTDQWANDDCRITRNFVCKRPSNNN